MSYWEFCTGNTSSRSFILGQAFHCPCKSPFFWLAQVIVRVQAIACTSCQGLEIKNKASVCLLPSISVDFCSICFSLLSILFLLVYLRVVGGEVGATSSLAPKIGPLGLVSTTVFFLFVIGVILFLRVHYCLIFI